MFLYSDAESVETKVELNKVSTSIEGYGVTDLIKVLGRRKGGFSYPSLWTFLSLFQFINFFVHSAFIILVKWPSSRFSKERLLIGSQAKQSVTFSHSVLSSNCSTVLTMRCSGAVLLPAINHPLALISSCLGFLIRLPPAFLFSS